MNSRQNTNDSAVRSLENSISVYAEYRSKIPTSHLNDELKQAKIQELDKQIRECETTIERLKQDVN